MEKHKKTAIHAVASIVVFLIIVAVSEKKDVGISALICVDWVLKYGKL